MRRFGARTKKTITVDHSESMEHPSLTTTFEPPMQSILGDANAWANVIFHSDPIGMADRFIVNNFHEIFPSISLEFIDHISDSYIESKNFGGHKIPTPGAVRLT